MIVEKCPVCGRSPRILDCAPSTDGTRRRLCGCPKLCSVISVQALSPEKNVEHWLSDGLWSLTSCFVFRGDGDDNSIYKVWNRAVIKPKLIWEDENEET